MEQINKKSNIIFIFINIILIIVFIKIEDNLNNDLMELILGFNEEYGVLVQTTKNNLNPSPFKDDSILDTFNKNLNIRLNKEKKLSHKISAFPYIEITTNDLLSLPYETTNKHEFDGWVVKKNDPLLQDDLKASSSQLQIILNERLFNHTFNCERYIKAISLYLLKADTPSFDNTKETPKEACIKNDTLFLKITLNGIQQLVPFNIQWYKPHFPMPKPISYIISVPQYYKLNYFRRRNNIFNTFNYSKDSKDKTWITSLKYTRETTSSEVSEKLLNCLRPDKTTQRSDILKMTSPTAIYFVKNCAEKSGFSFYKDIREISNPSRDYLTIIDSYQLGGVIFKRGTAQKKEPCYLADEECSKKINIMVNKADYKGAVLYVKEYTRVTDVVEEIKLSLDHSPPLLNISGAYAGALEQFKSLEKNIHLLKLVFFIAFIGFLILIYSYILYYHNQHFIEKIKTQNIIDVIIQVSQNLCIILLCILIFYDFIPFHIENKIKEILNKDLYQDYTILIKELYDLNAFIITTIIIIMVVIIMKPVNQKEINH